MFTDLSKENNTPSLPLEVKAGERRGAEIKDEGGDKGGGGER